MNWLLIGIGVCIAVVGMEYIIRIWEWRVGASISVREVPMQLETTMKGARSGTILQFDARAAGGGRIYCTRHMSESGKGFFTLEIREAESPTGTIDELSRILNRIHLQAKVRGTSPTREVEVNMERNCETAGQIVHQLLVNVWGIPQYNEQVRLKTKGRTIGLNPKLDKDGQLMWKEE